MTDRAKLFLVRRTPKSLLRLLWRAGIVRRATVFRWEMNLALGEWRPPTLAQHERDRLDFAVGASALLMLCIGSAITTAALFTLYWLAVA